MTDKEKIEALEKQVELLKEIIALEKEVAELKVKNENLSSWTITYPRIQPLPYEPYTYV